MKDSLMSLSSLFKERLPINRKELYYTATVLPCIVCADGLAHIHRLWELLDLDIPQVNATPELANIQFFTEFNAKQSIYIDLDRVRFPVEMGSGETPDVLILIDGPAPLMVSVEAKMYDTVTTADLLNQLKRQREQVLLPLACGIPNARLEQVALLPAGMSIAAEAILPARLLHWEHIVEKFGDVASASYFCGVLALALTHYDCLRNKKLVFQANMDAKMNGEEILKRYDEGTLVFLAMGRKGGSTGASFARDLASGGWRQQLYEVSSRDMPFPNGNWFAIKDFVGRIREIGRPD
jgi:hypothetical protein